jgi:DNA-binding transcriptional regulator YdaS (Cro superfamily)
MSETPITQQAEAAVTRINQLTERMLTADRNAGAGLAAAHEKALQSLVDNPADLKQPVEWVQALAAVHAKFIEEATDALVKTAGEASDVPVTGVLDEAEAQRIRSLNQQVLARASAAGTGAVDGYEKALQDMADFETKIAGNSQLDWLQAVARSHTKFVTDLASMYANAIRNGLSG